jgi:hypothetical protein
MTETVSDAKERDILSLPFDQYQRYRIVERVANLLRGRLGKSAMRIMDVGGHFRDMDGSDVLPIADFLPHDRAVALDVAECVRTGYIRANGGRLPVCDRAFDLVVSCDTLEHVSSGARPSFITESLRAAASCVVLVAPFDSEEARDAERILFDYVRLFFGHEQEQLSHHRALGLPQRALVEAQLDELQFPYVDFPSGCLHRWLPMMILKHNLYGQPNTQDLHRRVDRYYNRSFTEADLQAPAYRHVFVISVDRDLEFMRLVQRDFVRSRATEHTALARQIAAQDVVIAKLKESVDELQRQLAKLNEDMFSGPQGDFDDTGC